MTTDGTINVDFEGLERIRKHFRLLPHEVGQAMTAVISRATQAGRTAARQALRREYGLTREQANRRIFWKKSGRVWIGANSVPADWIPGLVEESRENVGGNLVIDFGSYDVTIPNPATRKVVIVAGQVAPNVFQLPLRGNPTFIRYGKGRRDFHRLEYDIMPGAQEAQEEGALAASQVLATKFYQEVARQKGVNALLGADRGEIQSLIAGRPGSSYKPTGSIGERILYPSFRGRDAAAAGP